MPKILAPSVFILSLLGAAGCTDLKPLEAQVDELKQQVTHLSSDQQALKAATDGAAHTASTAQSAAAQAQNHADAAALAAQIAQQGVEEINEKIDRMFKRSPK
jgi:outer membrane murein-binding lipoprotein Lpp